MEGPHGVAFYGMYELLMNRNLFLFILNISWVCHFVQSSQSSQLCTLLHLSSSILTLQSQIRNLKSKPRTSNPRTQTPSILNPNPRRRKTRQDKTRRNSFQKPSPIPSNKSHRRQRTQHTGHARIHDLRPKDVRSKISVTAS